MNNDERSFLSHDHLQAPENPASVNEIAEGEAVVVSVRGDTAWLKAQPKAACSSCATKEGCSVSVLSKLFGEKSSNAFPLANDFDAKVGDRVVVGLPQARVTEAALVAYMIPISGMVGVALAAAAAGASDLGVGLAALAGFLAGLVAMDRIAHAGSRKRFSPVFLRRVSEEPAPLTTLTPTS